MCIGFELVARREFRVHHDSTLLPIELAEILLGGAVAIDSRCIDFFVSMGLEHIEDLGAVLEIVYASLFGAYSQVSMRCNLNLVVCMVHMSTRFAQRHGAEDDVQSCL